MDVSITGNSTNPTRFQHPVAGTYKKECIEQGKKYFSVASGGGTGRTLHPDNMAAGPASYGMTDTMGSMHSDAHQLFGNRLEDESWRSLCREIQEDLLKQRVLFIVSHFGENFALQRLFRLYQFCRKNLSRKSENNA